MSRLSGWPAIADYAKRSETTVRIWQKTLNFPVVKLGGCVESDTELIDSWFLHTAKQLLAAATHAEKDSPGRGASAQG